MTGNLLKAQRMESQLDFALAFDAHFLAPGPGLCIAPLLPGQILMLTLIVGTIWKRHAADLNIEKAICASVLVLALLRRKSIQLLTHLLARLFLPSFWSDFVLAFERLLKLWAFRFIFSPFVSSRKCKSIGITNSKSFWLLWPAFKIAHLSHSSWLNFAKSEKKLHLISDSVLPVKRCEGAPLKTQFTRPLAKNILKRSINVFFIVSLCNERQLDQSTTESLWNTFLEALTPLLVSFLLQNFITLVLNLVWFFLGSLAGEKQVTKRKEKRTSGTKPFDPFNLF